MPRACVRNRVRADDGGASTHDDGLSTCLLLRQLVHPHLFAGGVPLDDGGGQQGEAHGGPDAAEDAVQGSECDAANADGSPRLQEAPREAPGPP